MVEPCRRLLLHEKKSIRDYSCRKEKLLFSAIGEWKIPKTVFFGLSAIVDENRRHWKRFALARLLKESEKGLKRGWTCSEKAFNFNQSFAQFTSEVCMRSHNLCQKLKLRDFTSFTDWKSKREIEARDLYCVVFYCWGNNIQAIKTQLKLDPCLSLPTI